MDRMIERCAGLDVHQATVVATVRIPGDHGRRQQVTETFATTAARLTARACSPRQGAPTPGPAPAVRDVAS